MGDALKRLVSWLVPAVTAWCWLGMAGDAVSGPRMYDLNHLLDRPHPFTVGPPSAASRTTPVPDIRVRPPARIPPPAPTPRYVQPAPPPASPTRRLTGAEMARLTEPPQRGLGGILSEIRVGGLIHDEGPFSRNEEDGFDVNLEFLFVSPKILETIWSPRPHIGGTFNTDGDTSQIYFGLSWEWAFWKSWFAGFSLGGSVHDGETETNELGRKELGCHLLFRESVEFGTRLSGKHGVSVFLDHISNANICDKNEGLENFGLRYGYRF